MTKKAKVTQTNSDRSRVVDRIWMYGSMVIGAGFIGSFFGDWVGAGIGIGAAITLAYSIHRKEKSNVK